MLKLHEDMPRETNWLAEVAWLFSTFEDTKSVVTCLAAMLHECRHLFVLRNISLNILCILYQGRISAIITDQKSLSSLFVAEVKFYSFSQENIVHKRIFTGEYLHRTVTAYFK